MRRLLCVALTLLAAAGCCPKKIPTTAYYGPTDGLPTLVEKLNARNGRVVSLRGQGDFSADLIDPQTGKHTRGDGDLTLLYTPPGNLRLVAKVLTEKVFDAGSNAAEYWLILPQQDTLYHGTRAAAAGHAARLPVRPDLLVEVLGVTPLDPDLLREPVPTLRFNNDQDCYVLTFQTSLPDRWAVQKEIWYDRQTLLPQRVLLYDANGRVVLRADVSQPMTVVGYTPPVTLASRYDLFFSDSGSTFSIRLKDLDHDRNGAPNAKSFAFPGDRSGVSKQVSLDR